MAGVSIRGFLRPLVVRLHRWLGLAGVHVLPNHYYSCFADMNELARNRQWAFPSEMPGIEMDLARQIANLKLVRPFVGETEIRELPRESEMQGLGLGFSYADGVVLYGMVRHLRPNRVIEVGGGITSLIIQRALARNGTQAKHAVVEPFASPGLCGLSGIQLIPRPLQQLDRQTFAELQSGDLLFVDSTHTVKPGSDVNFMILEVLPRLNQGVVVHVHDINFPYDYQPDLLQTLYQWSEGSLLRAFLTHNPNCEVLFSLSHIHHQAPEELKALIPDYRPVPMKAGLFARPLSEVRAGRWHFAASTYLQTKSGSP